MKPLLNRLLLGQKFLLLALIGALLVIAPLTLFVRESNKAISAAELEAGAIQPLQTLLKVVQLTQLHAILLYLQLLGIFLYRPF
jgi:hypothetical protein